MNTQIIQGSLGAIAAQDKKSIAETFVNADVVILTDTSISMCAEDAGNGLSRYEKACNELKNLQASLPGKLALLSFSDDVIFCPNGVPFNYKGGTDLTRALKFAKMADVKGMRFIVISDGEPHDEQGALDVAKTYKNRIDTIYVGPEGGEGQAFLRRLAKASGGQGVTSAQVKSLESTVKHLLTA
jgi:hypothetical protein